MNYSNDSIVLRLEDVGFFFNKRKKIIFSDKFWALREVNLTLFKGESLGIIGRNGAGKSILLKMLAGIISPDKGNLFNYGYTTSLVSLQAGFLPNLTGRENVILNGLVLGLKKKKILSEMDNIHSFSGLESFFDEPIKTYSSGMRARLGFSISLELIPDVFLIDEALGVGDESFKRKSTEKIKERFLSDKTVVLVSHDRNTIRELCDRAVWIEKGVTRAEGDVDYVFSEYNRYFSSKR